MINSHEIKINLSLLQLHQGYGTIIELFFHEEEEVKTKQNSTSNRIEEREEDTIERERERLLIGYKQV